MRKSRDDSQAFVDFTTGSLAGGVFRLRICVWAIQEEGHDFLEELVAHVYGSVDAFGRVDPIYFTNGNVPRQAFPAIAKLDLEKIPA